MTGKVPLHLRLTPNTTTYYTTTTTTRPTGCGFLSTHYRVLPTPFELHLSLQFPPSPLSFLPLSSLRASNCNPYLLLESLWSTSSAGKKCGEKSERANQSTKSDQGPVSLIAITDVDCVSSIHGGWLPIIKTLLWRHGSSREWHNIHTYLGHHLPNGSHVQPRKAVDQRSRQCKHQE